MTDSIAQPNPQSSTLRGSLTLGGLHGHKAYLHVEPTYPEGDSRNIPTPPGTRVTYRVVFVLSRPGVTLRAEGSSLRC